SERMIDFKKKVAQMTQKNSNGASSMSTDEVGKSVRDAYSNLVMNVLYMIKQKEESQSKIEQVADAKNSENSSGASSSAKNAQAIACKTVSISSIKQGDGKCEIARNLAVALAKINKKVLLLNLDLDDLSIVKYLKINENCGLEEIVCNSAKIEEVVQKSAIEGLDILVGTTAMANSQKVLLSDNFATVMDTLKASYDWIIVNSPSIEFLVNVSMINNMCDTCLLVVDNQQDRRRKVLQAKEIIGNKFCGIVLSNTKLGKTKYLNSCQFFKEKQRQENFLNAQQNAF
ncbi:MAG: polysaccharide biosynthesis tyrosine autokinase, partial [Clostridia bacterium]